MTKTGIRLDGGLELIAALEELKGLTTERTARAALTKEMDRALEPVAEAARTLAPRSALARKHMADGIGVGGTLTKSQKRGLSAGAKSAFHAAMRKTGNKGAARDALRAARRGEGTAKTSVPLERYVGVKSGFATLAEFGTGPRKTKKGKFLGASPPRPFLRPAWDAEGPQVMTRLTGSLRTALAKKIATARKKKGL